MSKDSIHPMERLSAAIETLEVSRADLQRRAGELVGYEAEYLSITDSLIGMMKSAMQSHWFRVARNDGWSTKDSWKLDALALADSLVKDKDDEGTDN